MGHQIEDVIGFCVDFIPGLKKIGLPQSRYEGRLTGKGTLGKGSIICRYGYSWSKAHYTVLQNSTLVDPYVDEHMNSLRSTHPEQSDDSITREHIRTFGSWLESRLRGDNTISDELYSLSRKPSSTVLTYKGYEINGNTFYTVDQDQKSTNQNSGVRFDAATKSGKDTYYGYIVDIWELDYGDDFKVPLFKCKWVNMSGVQVDPQYGMTTVDLNNIGYPDEPFVLANDVAQIFYVKDMSTKPRKRKNKEVNTSYDDPKRHIVLSGKKTSLDWRARQTSLKIMKSFMKFLPSKSRLIQASC
jgi:hypothetical protein